LVRDVASAYRSPSSTSAISADRADSNGGPHTADDEQQAQQHRQWRARDRHPGHEQRPGGVGGDEHAVPGEPVGQGRQQRPAEQPRQVADREGDRDSSGESVRW
jgi:hypothetical protein